MRVAPACRLSPMPPSCTYVRTARLLDVVRDRATFPLASPELAHEALFSDEKVRRVVALVLEETLADGV